MLSFAVLLLLWQAVKAREPVLIPPQGAVERFGRGEFAIELDRQYAHPFDPSEIELTLVVESPSGKRVSVPAFYFQPCEVRRIAGPRGPRDWIYPAGSPRWLARFAPAEVGTYRAKAQLTDKDGTAYSKPVSFESTFSESRGFLRVSEKDPRYLGFEDGSVFFGIGQNLAFIGPTQAMTPVRAREALGKLSEHGANFVRVWTGCQDWALAIESPRSAWGRSWSKEQPVADLPGTKGRKAVRIGDPISAAPYDAIPVRPATVYRLAGSAVFEGASGLRIEPTRQADDFFVVQSSKGGEETFEQTFCTSENQYYLDRIKLTRVGDGVVWLTALSLRESGGGPELLVDADPDLPRRGIYHQIDAFVLDQLVEAAREDGVYLQLCVAMRDLYMGALKAPESSDYDEAIRDAQNLMRYFVARWGYSTSVAVWEYFNEMNPGLPTDRFYTEMAEYLDRIDPYRHPRATSTWGTSHRDWRHPRLDIPQEHHYLRPSTLSKTPDVVAAVAARAAELREHSTGRPMFLAEFGLADEKWGLSPRMEEDERLEHFHNALWASSLSGLSGTAMFWWWEQLDRRDAYTHYRPLADFLKEVPFGDVELRPGNGEVTHSREIVAVGLEGAGHGYYWLYDPGNSWERKDSKEPGVEQNVEGAVLRLRDPERGRYAVEWWDTWSGEMIRRDVVSASAGVLEIPVPTFQHDMACRIVRERGR